MSYSYVKSVFPDFKYSNVYDAKLYETKPSLNENENENMVRPAEQNEGTFVEIKEKDKNIEQFQNNLKFYNTPHPMEEKFDNLKETNHSEYTKHILECESCKQLIMKQLNIENDRLKSEEIMELISFIMLGIFILLLLDSIKK
jgi:hypothetical protein